MKLARPNFRRIAILGTRHRVLLLRCWLVLAAIRLTLTFKSYRPVLRHIQGTSPDWQDAPPVGVLVWAITHAARLVPGGSCLTQALALRYFMARAGLPGTIRIGVAQNEGGGVEAHAWVVDAERVLIGNIRYDIRRFTPIVDL